MLVNYRDIINYTITIKLKFKNFYMKQHIVDTNISQ
jgi:hypothetical protein